MKQLSDLQPEPSVVDAKVDEVLMPGQLSQAEVKQAADKAGRDKLRVQGAAIRMIFSGLGPTNDWFSHYD